MIIDFCAHHISVSVAKKVNFEHSFPPESETAEERLRIMEKFGIDVQVLSPTTPVLTELGPKEAAEICITSNDSAYELCEKYPEKFVGMGMVSLLDVQSALDELDRTINDLGFKGVTIATNQNGTGLDSPEYIPFYDKVAKHDIPIFLQPINWKSYPLIEGEKGYRLLGSIGWAFDTTQAVCRLIYGKILERYPSLQIVTHHLGGYLPYSRVETTFLGLKEKLGLTKPISEYLKQVYGDTAISGMGAIREAILPCGYAFFGSTRTIFGTDYPFGGEKGERYVRENLKSVKILNVSEKDRSEILEKNTKRLLKLT